jgi:hypothetical protein
MRLVVRWVACGGCALIALAFFGIVIGRARVALAEDDGILTVFSSSKP